MKDEESLKVFLDVLKSYEKVSGLKINISKSECMWIGVSRNCKREGLGLKWPKRPIKCLGVYLTYDYDEFIKLNYKQRFKKMKDTANWWRGRGLTMHGRAQIINSLLLSKLIYIASKLCFQYHRKLLKKLIGSFSNFYGKDRTGQPVKL